MSDPDAQTAIQQANKLACDCVGPDYHQTGRAACVISQLLGVIAAIEASKDAEIAQLKRHHAEQIIEMTARIAFVCGTDTPDTHRKARATLIDRLGQLQERAEQLDAEIAQPLTFEQFSKINRERCESPSGFNHTLSSWSTSDWFTAIVGELGEAANVAKKLNRIRDGIPGNKETESVLRDKLRRELADSFVYLDLLAQALGFNIGAAAVDVFNAKSDEIGYPIRFPERAEAALAQMKEWQPIDTDALRAALRWFDGQAHASKGAPSINSVLQHERDHAIHRLTLVQAINLIDIHQRESAPPPPAAQRQEPT